MGKKTDQIFDEIKNNKNDEKTVQFIEETEVRDDLLRNINETGISHNKIADKCGIQPSQFSDFLKGKKKLGRDKLLALFIELDYSLDKTQSMLSRFGECPLYVREKRDYQIASAIQAHKSLDEIDEILIEKNIKPIMS